MEDKESLLNSIRNFPEEDIVRLMYADYLDENGNSDLDLATSQFIRISCKLQNKKRQYSDEGKWLNENWHRLVPSLHSEGFELHRRLGRFVTLKKKYDTPTRRRNLNTWVIFEFWKGFAKSANVYRPNDIKQVFPLIFKDQRLTEPSVLGLPRWGRIEIGGENQECFFISERMSKEIFDLITTYDTDRIPFFCPSNEKAKVFIGEDCGKRARKAVAEAISGWCISV